MQYHGRYRSDQTGHGSLKRSDASEMRHEIGVFLDLRYLGQHGKAPEFGQMSSYMVNLQSSAVAT